MNGTPPGVYYAELTTKSVRDVLPPNQAGATEQLLTDFLEEAERDVTLAIGTLPEPPDKLVRAVIRDLAAGRALLKLVGSDDDPGRRSAEALISFAWGRLERWSEALFDASGGDFEGSSNLSNYNREGVWNRKNGVLHGEIDAWPMGPWTESW